MLVESSVLDEGVNVPDQVMLSLLLIVESVPLGAVISAELENEITASEKTSVTVALSPTFKAVSDIVNELAEGARVSTS